MIKIFPILLILILGQQSPEYKLDKVISVPLVLNDKEKQDLSLIINGRSKDTVRLNIDKVRIVKGKANIEIYADDDKIGVFSFFPEHMQILPSDFMLSMNQSLIRLKHIPKKITFKLVELHKDKNSQIIFNKIWIEIIPNKDKDFKYERKYD